VIQDLVLECFTRKSPLDQRLESCRGTNEKIVEVIACQATSGNNPRNGSAIILPTSLIKKCEIKSERARILIPSQMKAGYSAPFSSKSPSRRNSFGAELALLLCKVRRQSG